MSAYIVHTVHPTEDLLRGRFPDIQSARAALAAFCVERESTSSWHAYWRGEDEALIMPDSYHVSDSLYLLEVIEAVPDGPPTLDLVS